MCKFLILLFIILLSFKSFAQYSSEGEDLISRFRPGTMWFFTGLRPAIPEKARKYDRLMFDVTYTTWSGDIKPFRSNWNSIGLNTSFMFDIPLTKGNTVSFGTGFSHSIFKIHSASHIFVPDSTNIFTKHYVSAGFIPDRNYICGNSFSVPLEFRFRTKGWKHFKVHAGGKIGYQLNVYSKVVTNGENGKYVQKDHGFADVNRLIYSAHVRIGTRNWALFGSYNFNTLFSNRSSVKLNVLQVGLTISFY